ncbi:MAG: hypothetical protein HY885_13075 [Deltaproteobacteria bacterium]|nr:hypothetical protein [Deltaproteobacteria bacterium]
MKSTMPEANVQVKTRSHSQASETANTGLEVSKGAMIALSAVPALAGVWAAACLFGGLLASGGPIGLIKSWFSAVMGM